MHSRAHRTIPDSMRRPAQINRPSWTAFYLGPSREHQMCAVVLRGPMGSFDPSQTTSASPCQFVPSAGIPSRISPDRVINLETDE
jgi:hypothetical protein